MLHLYSRWVVISQFSVWWWVRWVSAGELRLISTVEYCNLSSWLHIVYDAVIMTCAGTDHHLKVCLTPRSWHSWADYNTRTTWPPRKEYQVSTCDFHVIWMWFTCMACDLHDSLWLHVSYICVMLAVYVMHVLQMCCWWLAWLDHVTCTWS